MPLRPLSAALFPALFLLLSAVPSGAQTRSSDTVTYLEIGLYCADRPEDAEDAPGTEDGYALLFADRPDLLSDGPVVPASFGVGFGMHIQLRPDYPFDRVQLKLTHPAFPGSGRTQQSWQSRISTTQPVLIGYLLGIPEQVIAGRWTFTLSDPDGRFIAEAAFDVVPPAQFGPLPDGCGYAVVG